MERPTDGYGRAVIYWRSTAQRYRLVGTMCENCGTKSFPPRPVHQKWEIKDKNIMLQKAEPIEGIGPG